MWFDHFVLGDPFQTIPDNSATNVSFANVYASDPALFSFSTVANPNDTLNLLSTSHLYLLSSTAGWNLSGFVQSVNLSGGGLAIVGGQLLGDISLHSAHPADYFTLVTPLVGVHQAAIDYMLVIPPSSPTVVNLAAFQKSGSAKDLFRGVIAAVAFPLA